MLKDTDLSRAGARQYAQKPCSLLACCGSHVLPGALFCFVRFMRSAQASSRSRCGQAHEWKQQRIAARPAAFLCQPYDLLGDRYTLKLFADASVGSGVVKHAA
jgi:hypothetical protein